jgi:cyclophilin family peptidyl-prolyl cis-trans isomerase
MTPLRLAGAVVAALLVVTGCASDSDESADDETTTDAPCPPIDGVDSQTREFDAAPPACLDPGASYEAVVTTNVGEFTIAVDPDTAPVAANNFVFLARNRYFDDTVCHRIIPNFVVQCGDPTATGTGGPGYTIVDEPPTVPYEIGSIAMAKTAAPDSAGSQFFVITGSDGASLPPSMRCSAASSTASTPLSSRWPQPAHRRASRASRSRSNRSASSNADAEIRHSSLGCGALALGVVPRQVVGSVERSRCLAT